MPRRDFQAEPANNGPPTDDTARIIRVYVCVCDTGEKPRQLIRAARLIEFLLDPPLHGGNERARTARAERQLLTGDAAAVAGRGVR